ncbi:MAG: hypothetical protein ACKPJD_02800, partial [Planctomycetaceae bacterium]
EQYCTKGARLQSLYSSWQNQLQIASPELQQAICEATDDLIRLRLSGGAMHTVFAATIVFLLTKYGPLSTTRLIALSTESNLVRSGNTQCDLHNSILKGNRRSCCWTGCGSRSNFG